MSDRLTPQRAGVSRAAGPVPVASTLLAAPPVSGVARFADRRGLTAAGGVLVETVLATVGATVDVVTGRGLGLGFAVAFVTACALVALCVHKEDLGAAVVMPPLVYVVVALVAAAVEGGAASGSLLSRQALELANAVVLGAPVLLTATGVALLVALVRGLGRRRR